MNAKMVDISNKDTVYREAVAEGFIRLKKETIELVRNGYVEKGDVLSLSQMVGIMAAKKTSDLLPFCHPIQITHVLIDTELLNEGIKVTATVRAESKTGVEMEALMAVAMALLNVWDMVKKYEKDDKGQYPYTYIEYIKVIKKVKSSASLK